MKCQPAVSCPFLTLDGPIALAPLLSFLRRRCGEVSTRGCWQLAAQRRCYSVRGLSGGRPTGPEAGGR
jgi:hypothetical protein